MNRPFPPFPRGMRPARPGPEGYYAPAEVLMGLIRQSENRYATYRDLAIKQDAGFGQLQIDAQNMSIALSHHDPEGLQQLEASLRAALAAAQMNKYLLDQACAAELFLQGELKRWLKGQPPSQGAPPPVFHPQRMLPYGQGPAYGQGNGQGSHVFGPVPEGWYPPQTQGFPQQPQGQAQGYPQQPQGQVQGYPQQPQGPAQNPAEIDLRDPAAAAAFMQRAQPMPLGPVAQGQPQVPAYVPPAQAYVPQPASVTAPVPSAEPAPAPASVAAPAASNGTVQKGA
jgi:hypothetical protein